MSDLSMASEGLEPLLIRRRVLISGRVQGVFFRDSCCEQARMNHIFGWVRNTSDNEVEAVFEGTLNDVERLIEWSRRGPAQAAVESIKVQNEEPEGLTAFSIR